MASLKPTQSVVAAGIAGTITAALMPFISDLYARLAALSETWVAPFWHGILVPLTTQEFEGFTVVAVMTIVTWIVPDGAAPKPVPPADSQDSGEGGRP